MPVVAADHLRLAYKLAAKPSIRRHLPMDDAAQAGAIGLLRCDGFDPGRGTAFSSYAAPAIIREIQRERTQRQPAWLTATDVAVVGEDGQERNLVDQIADCRERDPAELAECRDEVTFLFGHLTARERAVLVSRFGLDGCGQRSMTAVARDLKLSRQRVYQLLATAFRRLRDLTRSRL